jgi:hypothetical protein
VRFSRDASEALLLLGGFAFVLAAGALTMLIWPTHIYGNWRLFAALAIAACLAIPTVLHLRRRLGDRW